MCVPLSIICTIVVCGMDVKGVCYGSASELNSAWLHHTHTQSNTNLIQDEILKLTSKPPLELIFYPAKEIGAYLANGLILGSGSMPARTELGCLEILTKAAKRRDHPY